MRKRARTLCLSPAGEGTNLNLSGGHYTDKSFPSQRISPHWFYRHDDIFLFFLSQVFFLPKRRKKRNLCVTYRFAVAQHFLTKNIQNTSAFRYSDESIIWAQLIKNSNVDDAFLYIYKGSTQHGDQPEIWLIWPEQWEVPGSIPGLFCAIWMFLFPPDTPVTSYALTFWHMPYSETRNAWIAAVKTLGSTHLISQNAN